MTSSGYLHPLASDILEAARRIAPFINHTPVLTSRYLNNLFHCLLYFKCENFQKVGAFKARGATNAVQSLTSEQRKQGVATHSSGNHAQALAWAASQIGIPAYLVMPSNSNPVKISAVKSYGGQITFCEPSLLSRESTLVDILKATGATEIHPYNNIKIIAGQATAALELIQEIKDPDLLLCPVGGGGLLSGSALSAHYFHPSTKVIATEPDQANDAYLSFESKTFVPSVNPNTIADGLRTSLGSITYPIILNHVYSVVTVRETTIIEAMRMIWERMKIVIEPSSAVPLAAILESKLNVAEKKVGIILSGGNADLDNLPWLSHG